MCFYYYHFFGEIKMYIIKIHGVFVLQCTFKIIQGPHNKQGKNVSYQVYKDNLHDIWIVVAFYA